MVRAWGPGRGDAQRPPPHLPQPFTHGPALCGLPSLGLPRPLRLWAGGERARRGQRKAVLGGSGETEPEPVTAQPYFFS